ncbi:MAG: flagellar basal body rod modification protein [Pusillimonas sp.]|nr:flagellar basal body rod modification protein [Pusillimonas sp.]
MTTVDPNAIAQATSASSLALSAAESSKRAEDMKNQFMTLLVTQLRNQDPLNPMENAEFTSQLAQLETVNGITQLNNTLQALSGQMDMTQSMQAATLIGKEVLVTGNKISTGSAADDPNTKVSTPFGVDLISSAEKVKVAILDGSGKAVRNVELGPVNAGVVSLEWDGLNDSGLPVPDGAYTLDVTAVGADGSAVGVEALTYGQVSSIAYASTGVQLDLGLMGSRSLFDVRKIM